MVEIIISNGCNRVSPLALRCWVGTVAVLAVAIPAALDVLVALALAVAQVLATQFTGFVLVLVCVVLVWIVLVEPVVVS